MPLNLQQSLSFQSKGILSLLGAIVFLTASDTIIKWLSPHYALHEIMLFRALFALLVTLVIIKFDGGFQILKTRRPFLHAFKAFLFVLANMFFFLGLANMPLADAVAVFFAAPIFICLLSKPVLGEAVGLWRWIAILVGMFGVIVMLRPGQDAFTASALLPLIAAFIYACVQLITRKLGMSEKAATHAFYLQIMFIVVSTLSGLLIGNGSFSGTGNASLDFLVRAWRWPDLDHLMVMSLCGLLVGFGAYLLSQAYRVAAVSVVAPFEYAAMPLAVFWGYQIWGDLPDLTTLLGSSLIILSGLVILVSERKKAQSNPELSRAKLG